MGTSLTFETFNKRQTRSCYKIWKPPRYTTSTYTYTLYTSRNIILNEDTCILCKFGIVASRCKNAASRYERAHEWRHTCIICQRDHLENELRVKRARPELTKVVHKASWYKLSKDFDCQVCRLFYSTQVWNNTGLDDTLDLSVVDTPEMSRWTRQVLDRKRKALRAYLLKWILSKSARKTVTLLKAFFFLNASHCLFVWQEKRVLPMYNTYKCTRTRFKVELASYFFWFLSMKKIVQVTCKFESL